MPRNIDNNSSVLPRANTTNGGQQGAGGGAAAGSAASQRASQGGAASTSGPATPGATSPVPSGTIPRPPIASSPAPLRTHVDGVDRAQPTAVCSDPALAKKIAEHEALIEEILHNQNLQGDRIDKIADS